MKQRDVIFKLGLGLQLLLIPVAFLWHFSSEANYYNLVLAVCFILIIAAFAWPQTLLGRLKRLRAIKIQLILVIILLAISWGAYAYFHHFTRTNCTPAYMLHNGSGQSGVITQSDLGKSCNFNASGINMGQSEVFYSVGHSWNMLLGPGISVLFASVMTLVFLALPSASFYRYKIDRKRIQGIKKEKLFI